MNQELIVLCGGVTAVGLAFVVLLFWNWLQAPMRLLSADVAALREERASSPPATLSSPSAQITPQRAQRATAARLEVLRSFEEELLEMQAGLREAFRRQATFPFVKKTTWWKAAKGRVSGVPDWQEFYETLRDAYGAVDAIPDHRHGTWEGDDSLRRKYQEAAMGINKGLAAVGAEIEKLRR